MSQRTHASVRRFLDDRRFDPKYQIKATWIFLTRLHTPFVMRDVKPVLFRDCRSLISRRLTGRGLEMGALARPAPVHAGMTVDYLDRAPVEVLRAHTRAAPGPAGDSRDHRRCADPVVNCAECL